MKIKKITQEENHYRLLVELTLFGEKHDAIFIGVKDADYSKRMCDACPLYSDCFEKDTLNYELCCFLELYYQTPLPNVDIGFLYMRVDSALEIKNIIDKKLNRTKKDEKRVEEIDFKNMISKSIQKILELTDEDENENSLNKKESNNIDKEKNKNYNNLFYDIL